ncbi:hypothetical protein [Palleronia pelagia]|uniref:Tetratricopeptide repeat-containing protein n=1 Tax=Palleronia pelagia TaxID=387096 RepID=A0A1H8J0W8_9RHOB|nr:hypothetical protein [Palleronia pelagia]SEN74382.1 hypothetical protein SAMN04488011_10621 [Palleronia pelagia]
MAKLLIEALDKAEAGEWDAAHEIVQQYDGRGAAWLHAYLHKVEGDDSNARYWYRKADMQPFEGDRYEELYALRQELTSGTEGMMGQKPAT